MSSILNGSCSRWWRSPYLDSYLLPEDAILGVFFDSILEIGVCSILPIYRFGSSMYIAGLFLIYSLPLTYSLPLGYSLSLDLGVSIMRELLLGLPE